MTQSEDSNGFVPMQQCFQRQASFKLMFPQSLTVKSVSKTQEPENNISNVLFCFHVTCKDAHSVLPFS